MPLEIVKDYDIIVDGTDNFSTRYLINDSCILKNKPMVYGGLFKFEGQISVFNYNGGPSYSVFSQIHRRLWRFQIVMKQVY